MSINLNHLAVFRAVAHGGSIRTGADSLLISQPAASKQIKQLEHAMHVVLFERHARGVRLTSAGSLLADYAKRIFALADDAEKALNDLSALRRGKLAIGASPTAGAYLLPRVLVHFRRRFPGIELHLEIETSQVLQTRLEEAALDFGITEAQIASPDIESSILTHDDLIAVAPPRHPLAKRRSVSLALFCQEPFITRETGSATRSFVERSLNERNMAIRPVLSLSSTEAIKQAVASGLGVAFVSRLTARNEIAAKRLAEVRITGVSIRRPLYHVWLRGKHQSKAAQAFLCLLKHAIRGSLPKLPAPGASRRA